MVTAHLHIPREVKVSYEKLIGTKGGTASMELGQTAREEPTLDDQLISLVSCLHAKLRDLVGRACCLNVVLLRPVQNLCH